jgi:hypothetical protein
VARFFAILGELTDGEWGGMRPLGIIEQQDRAELALKKVRWNFDGTFSMEEISNKQIKFYQDEIDKALFNELSQAEARAASLLADLRQSLPYGTSEAIPKNEPEQATDEPGSNGEAQKYLPHWTAEDIAKWEASKPKFLEKAKAAQLEIRHHVEQYKQEWESRVGTPFPGADLDSLIGMAKWADISDEDLKGMNAWDIIRTTIETLEARGDVAKSVEAKARNWSQELPFLQWKDSGDSMSVLMGQTEDGHWGFQCVDGSVIPHKSDPRLAEYEAYVAEKMDTRRAYIEESHEHARQQRYKLQVLTLGIARCEILAAKIADGSPVTDDTESLHSYREQFDSEIKELQADVATARTNLLRSGIQVPDEWLIFPVDGVEPRGVGTDGIAWRVDDAVRLEWDSVNKAIKAAIIRLEALSGHVITTPSPKKPITVAQVPVGAIESHHEPSAADDNQWSTPDSPTRLAKKFNFSRDTLMRRFKDGTIRHKKLSNKLYQIHIGDLPKSSPQ